jgi:hypothetical protein
VAVTVGKHVIGVDNLYPPLQGWHHLAVVLPTGARRSNQVKIYLDGEQQVLHTLDNTVGPVVIDTNTWSGDSYAYVGRDCDGHYYCGKMDDVRLYGRALREPEISSFRPSQRWYRAVDLGLLELPDNPQDSEALAINNQGDIIGRTIIDLKPDSTYYWRIDEKNECGVTEGETWQFTTDSD